eukprot:873480-Pelagomonas_calceolata.AAC.7
MQEKGELDCKKNNAKHTLMVKNYSRTIKVQTESSQSFCVLEKTRTRCKSQMLQSENLRGVNTASLPTMSDSSVLDFV